MTEKSAGTLRVEATSWQRRRRAAAVVVVTALVQGLAGCAHGPLMTRLRTDVVRPQPGVVLFLCDGLPPDLVERGCREGWLPNIRERFWESGTRVDDALTVVPAVTYAAITSMLTGVTPGTHGIPGNRWFDPGERLFRNYATIPHYRDVNFDFDVPTIYERIDPLQVNVNAVTEVMSYAFAQRHNIIAIEVSDDEVVIASAQPYMYQWESMLTQTLRGRRIKRVVTSPRDITKYQLEFYTMARSVSRAEASGLEISGVANFEQMLELGELKNPDANDGPGQRSHEERTCRNKRRSALNQVNRSGHRTHDGRMHQIRPHSFRRRDGHRPEQKERW